MKVAVWDLKPCFKFLKSHLQNLLVLLSLISIWWIFLSVGLSLFNLKNVGYPSTNHIQYQMTNTSKSKPVKTVDCLTVKENPGLQLPVL